MFLLLLNPEKARVYSIRALVLIVIPVITSLVIYWNYEEKIDEGGEKRQKGEGINCTRLEVKEEFAGQSQN